MSTERIEFYSNLGKVGHLDWSDGTMKFEGSIDDSARALFSNLSQIFLLKLQEAYEQGYTDANEEKIN
jgi:hypothetical protein